MTAVSGISTAVSAYVNTATANASANTAATNTQTNPPPPPAPSTAPVDQADAASGNGVYTAIASTSASTLRGSTVNVVA